MKKLPFLQELAEARLFYGPKDIKGRSAKEISEIVYLTIMLLEVIRQSNPSWSANYASQTMAYKTYENMHYSGTDLGNLLAVLNNQDTFSGKIKADPSIGIPLFQINRYLDALRSNSISKSDNAVFFYRLEDYLRLNNGAFRQMRRDIGNWDEMKYPDRIRLIQMIRRELDNRASSIDVYFWFKQSFKLKESINEDAQPVELVGYHGTNQEITDFTGVSYFTPQLDAAEGYARGKVNIHKTGSPRVYSACLKFNNPKYFDTLQQIGTLTVSDIETLKSLGYDGGIYLGTKREPIPEYVPFYPVKSTAVKMFEDNSNEVFESFDSNIKAQLIQSAPNLFITRAEIGGRTVEFQASLNVLEPMDDIEPPINCAEIIFVERTPGNMTFSKTGSGSEMQVFSFVIESIKELIKRYSPDEISFSADKADGNRGSLYKRMLARIKMPGYAMAETDSTGWAPADADTFKIVKIQQ